MKSMNCILFTIICGYSLVISAPIQENIQNENTVKPAEAANNLLQRLANEHSVNQQKAKNGENIQADTNDDDGGYAFEVDDLYPFFFHMDDGEHPTNTNDDDNNLLFDEKELKHYLEDQQRFDEDLISKIHALIHGEQNEL